MKVAASALQGRIVLVTGARGTLGHAVCQCIEQAGGMAIETDLPGRGDVDYVLDVTREDQWQTVISEIEHRHGRLDALVNNAGIIVVGDVEQTTFEDWRRVMAVNVDGTFLGCKYTLPLLSRSPAPAIVNISSVSGIVGGAGLAAYNASKGAVRLLTKSVALSGARKSPPVRCNSLHPAFIEGDMVAGLVKGARNPTRARERMQSDIPLGRMAQPDEIGGAVVWLLSDAAAFMTGAELVLDGGLVAR